MEKSGDAPAPPVKKGRATAERLADKQQEISVTEFFEKNKQILGFDSRTKSLLMGVKEAVDNALDACEETGILPDISVRLVKLGDEDFKVSIEDNGPGIVHRMMPNVFGRLLYGSRFHALRQSRGQQGIGISATIMYANLSTGRPAHVASRIEGEDEAAWEMDIAVDTKTNRPVVTDDKAFVWENKAHGTLIEYTTKGRYMTGKQSIFEYLKETAIVNPHACLVFHDPDGKVFTFERATETMPSKAKEIKPHPQGLEIGDLMRYAKDTAQKTLSSFLCNDFCRITPRIANEVSGMAKLKAEQDPQKLTRDQCQALTEALAQVKIMPPPTDCLSPIGDVLIKKGLMHILDGIRPEYYATPVTRPPKAVNGNPFLVEAGIVYGGEIPPDQQVSVMRFANRVPLLYQQGADVIIKAVADVDWRRYGLEQRGGKGVPFGPAIILVHVASTKVPFTSEGKEAIAALPEIQNEIELALKLCARNLKSHLNKKEQKAKTHEKFEIVQQILPDLANKSAEQLHRPVPDLARTIIRIMNVVWVEPGTIKENSARKITYTVFNYTNKARTFMLHAQLPPECSSPDLKKSNLFDSANNEGKTQWLIKDLQPAKSVQIVFTLAGDLADTFDPDDVYVSGISPLVVMGAEALPGDWGIRGLAITEEDETVLENDTAAEAEEQQEEKEEEDFDREEKDDYC
ncbi:MAG: DNA topoisomerase VI subunit B [Candidatus Methanomethylophilus sp.]|nr:DNA topoisomerase VI subunit B [Methanomethylophilus sp.]MDD3232915.1 DNA topoisomerase VI subunit B [Methanomethylophilus sp.]